MLTLDEKINEYFPGLVVRKNLVSRVKGNAVVPSYVLEYLLGQYCASNDEATIEVGIVKVKEILERHYVHRSEAGLVRSNIRERGRYKVIDKVSVDLNDKRDVYEATFSNLGISGVLVDTQTVKANEKLLVSGVWCIADLHYEFNDDPKLSPFVMDSLKAIQVSHFNFEEYLQARVQFSTDEWIDLLIQSMGFNPEYFSRRAKLHQLVRLVPFCERNYNLIELGPKGTGKSHIFSEFSPHAILISGGEVTVAKLFVNNASGKLGLVGYWDVVAFDEFAGKQKSSDKALVDIMKNYMANKSFSRGIETIGADASMVFVGNTQNSVPFMLRHADLFDDLPIKYHDSAFLDRLHFYVPGWEVDIIRNELFSDGYGFVVDYLAEILRHTRDLDYSDMLKPFFSLDATLSTRDRTGITKTFSGLMKVLYPHREATEAEIRELIEFAIEGRKRVKDQLMRIDSTYSRVEFTYTDRHGQAVHVQTQEEKQYPQHYHQHASDHEETDPPTLFDAPVMVPTLPIKAEAPQPRHLVISENQLGFSFDEVFSPYLAHATEITITDPYLRAFYQIKNLMELLETVVKLKPEGERVKVRVITSQDTQNTIIQGQNLDQVKEACKTVDIDFDWRFDESQVIHDRHIVTNHGWKIVLGRGLDVFQRYDLNNLLSFNTHIQKVRACKAFEVTIVRLSDPQP